MLGRGTPHRLWPGLCGMQADPAQQDLGGVKDSSRVFRVKSTETCTFFWESLSW